MLYNLLFVILLSSFNLTFANSNIAKFIKLKGDVQVQRNNKFIIAKNFPALFEKDIVSTQNKSFAKMKTIDNTTITLGPNSLFNFEKWTNKKSERHIIYNLIKGKLRTFIHKQTSQTESIIYKINSVAIGVRGTEFLANAYQVSGKKSTDFLLVKGKVKVDATKLNNSVKSFDLKAGQTFNSQDFSKNGLQAIKNVPKDLLDKIKLNSDYILPNLQLPNGSFLKMAELISLLTPLASKVLPISNNSKHKEAKLPLQKKLKVSSNFNHKQNQANQNIDRDFHYILKDEPVDIRNALIQYKNNIKNNKCYYWIYKKIAGGFKKLRFKRERKCNDFENNL